jgi:hypothetical protein
MTKDETMQCDVTHFIYKLNTHLLVWHTWKLKHETSYCEWPNKYITAKLNV